MCVTIFPRSSRGIGRLLRSRAVLLVQLYFPEVLVTASQSLRKRCCGCRAWGRVAVTSAILVLDCSPFPPKLSSCSISSWLFSKLAAFNSSFWNRVREAVFTASEPVSSVCIPEPMGSFHSPGILTQLSQPLFQECCHIRIGEITGDRDGVVFGVDDCLCSSLLE